MKVIAREGLRVPMEHAPRRYIDADTAIDVPDTAYYRRRIAEGDLVMQQDDAAAPAPDANEDAPCPPAKKTAKGA